MRYWWVNQNQTFTQEFQGGYLWSPKRKSNHAINPFYEFMREVAPGDVIFSFQVTRIVAIGSVYLTALSERLATALIGLIGFEARQIVQGNLIQDQPALDLAVPDILRWEDHVTDTIRAAREIRADGALYELLVLVDAIRGGRAREREIAVKELKQRLAHYA